jgi:hypothetical protein
MHPVSCGFSIDCVETASSNDFAAQTENNSHCPFIFKFWHRVRENGNYLYI